MEINILQASKREDMFYSEMLCLLSDNRLNEPGKAGSFFI
jgi:hypothetical protein